MRLGDIFDRIIKLIGRSIKRNAIIAIICLAIPSVLMTAGVTGFYSSLAEMMRSAAGGGGATAGDFTGLIASLALLLCVGIIFFVGYLASKLGVTIVACSEMMEEPMAWQAALRRAVGPPLGRAVGQVLLLILAMAGMMLIPFFLFILAGRSHSVMLGLLGVLAFFVAIPLAISYWVKWSMAITAIAWEDAGVLVSFGRSEWLVQGSWWRLFGMLLLFSIISQFAISLILTPVTFIAMWRTYLEYFRMLGSLRHSSPDPETFARMLSGMGLGVGISASLSLMLAMLIEPVYTTVLYFDLRARKREFEPPAIPPAAAPAAQIGSM